MDADRKRKQNKNKRNVNIVKWRLKCYGEDLELLDSLKERISIKRDKMDLKGGWSDSEAVQGGGSTQEDKLNALLDDITKAERTMTMIELENRAIKYSIDSLPDEDMKSIVYHVWAKDDKTMEQMSQELHLSKTNVWRKSDAALLYIYKKMAIIDPFISED